MATAAVAAVALVGGVGEDAAAEGKRDEEVARAQRAGERADEARSQLEGVNADLAEAVLHLQEVKGEVASAQEALAAAESRLADSERTRAASAAQLRAVEGEAQRLREAVAADEAAEESERRGIAALVQQRYRGEASFSALSFLFDSDVTTSQLTDRVEAAATAAQIRDREIRAVQARLASLRVKKRREEAMTLRARDLRALADEQVAAAEKAKRERSDAVDAVKAAQVKAEAAQADLEAKKGTLSADLEQAEAEQRAATAEIARIDEENRRRAEEAARLAQQAQQNAGGGSRSMFASPLRHALHVTSPYGYRIHPILGYRKLHMGVDLASPCGESQFASLGGQVVSTQYEGSGGNTVTINHGLINGVSWVTKYRHMTRFAVSPGQKVNQGQLIGYSGATGAVTGCHVHFEIWKNGVTIDPMGML